MHERGVDLIFIFSYMHLFRKLYLNIFDFETEASWKAGVFSFLIFQVVVFLGLILCCTHLSEITLTIAANIFHTFFLFKGKFYYWLFTDKQLNTDTMIRLAYAHYLAAFYLSFAGLIHGIDMHYDWKNESFFDSLNIEMFWWDEALSNELTTLFYILFLLTLFFFFLFEEPESLTYEIFMWGDIGLLTDIRFYGVAPHWYFRPFMAWLIACPFHKTGIFGLVFFFFILYFQPNIHGVSEQSILNKKIFVALDQKFKRSGYFVTMPIVNEANLIHQLGFFFFVMCVLYTTSFLPYGRFYNQLGGNLGFLGSYFYVFAYLAFPFIRKPLFFNLYYYDLYQSSYYLRFYNDAEVNWHNSDFK
uniref:cytochrome b n=1 Tax=Paramecium gigas TaxID=2709424 RepID=UPI001D01759B|nr:cytochrome b [Paramecium gigas]QVG61507.1 cytochrome b [Paramecium gigas]